MEELITLADSGDVIAQEKVGTSYMKGTNGVSKNQQEAIKYFEMASNNGSGMASYQLGKAYENGNGVEKNLKKAKEYYQKSADLGYANAVNILKQMQNQTSNNNNDDRAEMANIGTAYKAPETISKIEETKSIEYKKQSKAFWLAIFLGMLGAHNFYLGYTKKAIIQVILSCCGIGFISYVWALAEAWEIKSGKMNDSKGGRLV